MNFFEKYTNPNSSFLRSSDEGGAPAPTGTPAAVPVVDAGGVSPTPSDAPSATDASNTSADDFSGFDGDDLDSIDLGTETVPGQDPPVAAPAAVVAKVPTATSAVVPDPKATPAPVAATPDPKGSAASAPPSSELENLLSGVDANAPALTEWLAQNAFALTKEEAEAFELDAVANVPRLMARVAVNNMKSTMNIVKNLVPQLIAAEVAKITGTQAKAKEAIGAFYKANPHLNETDHGALVTKWANAFRSANPKASREEAIAYVGRAVSFETGLMPGTAVAPSAKPVPFQPARPGGRQPIATQQDEGQYAGLGGTFDED